MISVFLNGQEVKITQEITLFDFLTQNDLVSSSGIAIALNQSVIPKKDWKNTQLKHNDKILIITATQGG